MIHTEDDAVIENLLQVIHQITEKVAEARGEGEDWLDNLHHTIGAHFTAVSRPTDTPLQVTPLQRKRSSLSSERSFAFQAASTEQSSRSANTFAGT